MPNVFFMIKPCLLFISVIALSGKPDADIKVQALTIDSRAFAFNNFGLPESQRVFHHADLPHRQYTEESDACDSEKSFDLQLLPH